ncbi:MAG TPA: lecithin retinol acyltransferase family protein [Gaiellaceae bacterium]|nr:lecithin retinol acyltransferase family protein [Gaiellaceae bacterium]
MAAFSRSDHIYVRRALGYEHHGIYVRDERVLQFGGSIWDKPHASVGPVTLETFERGRRAKLYKHGSRTWWGVRRFPALPRERIVRRAERLVEMQPEGLYDLLGYNCEHAANFCSTNSYESYQVRGFDAVRLLISYPVAFLLSDRRRALSRRAAFAASMWALAGIVSHWHRHRSGERFMEEVGRPLVQ